jgi:hypothetical protein
MPAQHLVPNTDPTPLDAACTECGQSFPFCQKCNAPIEKKRKGLVFVFIGLSLLGICLIAAYVITCVRLSRDPSLLAPYLGKQPFNTWTILSSMGEMFGGLNCIVSGLAFAALIYSLAQQRRELRYQRHSMAESRREMNLSIKAQVDSANALSLQIEHMRVTTTIDGLGAMLRSFDAQIASSLLVIKEIEAAGGDATTLTAERSNIQHLRQTRDLTVTRLDDAINLAPQLRNQ